MTLKNSFNGNPYGDKQLPELPEVENIAQGLRREVLSRKIIRAALTQPLIVKGPYAPSPNAALKHLKNAAIRAVSRRAKRLLIFLNQPFGIIVQLGMTGNIRLTPHRQQRAKHTHLILTLDDGRDIRFIDPRRFGRVWFVDNFHPDRVDPIMQSLGMGPLGPEPHDLTLAHLTKILNCDRPVKSLLLDQAKIAGLGNIYADESLHRARIAPQRHCRDIPAPQIQALRRAIRHIIRQAVNHGGTTFNDYRNAYGDMGSFLARLRVYQRTSQPCKTCHTPIEKITIAGRSSHFCPHCQH